MPLEPDAGPPAASVDRVEMEKLREMLREHQQATLRAMHTAMQLQTRLTSAEAEVEKIEKKYQNREASTKTEVVRTAPQRSLPRKEPAARRPAIPAKASPRHRRAKRRMVRRTVIAVAVSVTTIGLGVVVWAAFGTQQTVRVTDAPAPIASPPALVVESTSAPPDSSTAFTIAMDALDDALDEFPGRTPEDVLSEAAKKDRACMLQWNGGHPSLLFGNTRSRPNSLYLTIIQCANAVRRLRPG